MFAAVAIAALTIAVLWSSRLWTDVKCRCKKVADAEVQTVSFAESVMNDVKERERLLMTKTVDTLKALCLKVGINAGSGPAKPLLARGLACTFSYDPVSEAIDGSLV